MLYHKRKPFEYYEHQNAYILDLIGFLMISQPDKVLFYYYLSSTQFLTTFYYFQYQEPD